MAMNEQELKRFAAQNVEYGFSADVMPSTLGPRRAALAPMNVTTGSMPGSNGPQNGRFSAKNPDYRVYPKLRPQGPEYRRGPRAKPVAPIEPAAPVNPYANGGDGTVARATGPDRYNTNIAGGLSRDELIRRMEMASTTMRGSPSARAAVLGVYADQVKALDQGELEKNKGNIDASQLQYKGEMDANMQEARGRQDFGNNMGILNRKAELDAAAAKAAMDPEKRALELAKTRSDIAVNEATAAMKKGEYEALIGGKQDAAIMDAATKLYAGGKGKYATMDDAIAAAAMKSLRAGNDPRSSTPTRELDNAITERAIGTLGTDNFLAELYTKGWSGASFGQSEQLDPEKVYSADDLELKREDSWLNNFYTGVLGMDSYQTLKPKGTGLGYGDPTKRLNPRDPEDAKIIELMQLRRRASVQQGQ